MILFYTKRGGCNNCYKKIFTETPVPSPIPDPVTDTVVVTGGDGEGDYGVVRYSEQGWLEDLPPLITGRITHACSSFVSSGRVVS